jgi:hypothetical protein
MPETDRLQLRTMMFPLEYAKLLTEGNDLQAETITIQAREHGRFKVASRTEIESPRFQGMVGMRGAHNSPQRTHTARMHHVPEQY